MKTLLQLNTSISAASGEASKQAALAGAASAIAQLNAPVRIAA